MFDYLKDPQAIYQKSFSLIEKELAEPLAKGLIPNEMRDIYVRIIHACGMMEVAGHLRYSPNILEAARAALVPGVSVFCDSRMVRAGMIRNYLPKDTNIKISLNDPNTLPLAKLLGTTRSAAALELWPEKELSDGIVVIGNAPTALFHLMERIAAGILPEPKLIIGMPVGFVGAAESKQALFDFPFKKAGIITILGRQGGSAMAAAALNALAKTVA
ncbi:MAG: precorrin-8X methylmutase [Alphaproteobacteria bacterium]